VGYSSLNAEAAESDISTLPVCDKLRMDALLASKEFSADPTKTFAALREGALGGTSSFSSIADRFSEAC
jgi:hypothetical protein